MISTGFIEEAERDFSKSFIWECLLSFQFIHVPIPISGVTNILTHISTFTFPPDNSILFGRGSVEMWDEEYRRMPTDLTVTVNIALVSPCVYWYSLFVYPFPVVFIKIKMSQLQPGLHRITLSPIYTHFYNSHSLCVLPFPECTHFLNSPCRDSSRAWQFSLSEVMSFSFFSASCLNILSCSTSFNKGASFYNKKTEKFEPQTTVIFTNIYLHGCHLSHCSVSIFTKKTLKILQLFQ